MASSRLNAKNELELIASDEQPGGAHNAGEVVENVGAMLWEATKKEWVPLSSGNTKDGESASEAMPVQNLLLNQSGTMDRQRNNIFEVVALASEARTATASSSYVTNYNWTKLHIRLNVTANPGGSRHLTVSVFDGFSALVCRFPTVETSWAFQMAPGLEAEQIKGNSENAHSANAVVPGKFLIQVIPSDSTSWTYQVNYDLLV